MKGRKKLAYSEALKLIARFGSGSSRDETRLAKGRWDFIIYKDGQGSLYEHKSLWLDPQDRIIGTKGNQARRMSVAESFDLFKEIMLDEVGHCTQEVPLKAYLERVASALRRKAVLQRN